MAEYLLHRVAEKLSAEKEKLPIEPRKHVTWLKSKFSWLVRRSEEDVSKMKQTLLKNQSSDLTSIAQETENLVDNFLCYVQQHPPLQTRGKLLARLETLILEEKMGLIHSDLRREEEKLESELSRIKEKMCDILTSIPIDEEIVAASDSGNYFYPTGLAYIYDQLDDKTKLSFLFHGIFPEGFKISKRRLVHLWIAEGWVEEEEEDTATIYKEKMTPFTTKNALCDVQEFCIMTAKQLNLYKIDNGKNEDSSSSSSSKGEIISRLALCSGGICSLMYNQNATLPSDLRSLFCFPQLTAIGGESSFYPSLGGLKLLRVLDLEDMYFITELPEDMGQHLTLLKYLGLRRTGLERLPTSLGCLTNLQTLDIKHTRVCSVPNSIQNLKQLRRIFMDMDHARADDDDVVVSPDVSALEELSVLSMVRAEQWMEGGIGDLSNLRKLGIYGNSDLCKNILLNGLPRMNRLKWLRLGFGVRHVDLEPILTCIRNSNSTIRHLYLKRPLKSLPGKNKFHEQLGYLCLEWTKLEQDPMPTLEQLPNLQVLKLRCGSFLGKKMVCSRKGFPSINELELLLLDWLEEWVVEIGAMSQLKCLAIRLCKRLKMLPQALQHLECLEKLQVEGMSHTFNAKLQHEEGHVGSITIDGIKMGTS